MKGFLSCHFLLSLYPNTHIHTSLYGRELARWPEASPLRFETGEQVLGTTFTLYNVYSHSSLKFCIDLGSLLWWNAWKLIPLPAKGVDNRITTVRRSSAGPFLWDGLWYCHPFAFGSEPAFFWEGRSILGYLPSFDQKLTREQKSPALVRKLRNQDVGHGAGVKMPNIAILIIIKKKKTPVNCSYCYVPGTELPVSSTRRLEEQVMPPQQLQRSDQICKESYNGSYSLHTQVTALDSLENWVLLILSGRFSFLQRGKSELASKGVRQKTPNLTHLKPVINAARKGIASWLTLHCHC